MNVALGTILAIAFINAVKESQRTRNVRYPDTKVNRPRITSNYPLRYIVINDAIGGVSEGLTKVFPNARFMGFTPDETRGLAKDMQVERVHRGQHPKPIVNFNQTLSTQFIYYRLNIKQSTRNPMFTTHPYQPWRESPTWERFLKIVGSAKAKDFIIEIDKFKGFDIESDLTGLVKSITASARGRISTKDIHLHVLDACLFTGQKNEKIYLTSFPLVLHQYIRLQSFVSNLDPIEDVRKSYEPSAKHLRYMIGGKVPAYRKGSHSDTGVLKGGTSPQTCMKKMPANPLSEPYLLVDRRTGEPLLRSFTLEQLERFAGFPTNYMEFRKGQNPGKILSKSTNPLIVQFLAANLAISRPLFQAVVEDQ